MNEASHIQRHEARADRKFQRPSENTRFPRAILDTPISDTSEQQRFVAW